jgi:hypothetical protein
VVPISSDTYGREPQDVTNLPYKTPYETIFPFFHLCKYPQYPNAQICKPEVTENFCPFLFFS